VTAAVGDASSAVLTAIASGLVLGVGGGVAPGPLLTLVVSESLRRGARAGVAVACAPLVTDAPIIGLALMAINRIAGDPHWLAALSFAGAAVVAWLGWEAVAHPRPPDVEVVSAAPSLWRGVLANLVNPSPWLFWTTVGAASLLRAVTAGWSGVVAFLVAFYVGLVGSKVTIAVVVSRAGSRLTGRGLCAVQRALGVVLWGFALWLVIDGVRRVAGGPPL
jgi:threonine/homoserine/homoserine lactone efflux protein